MPILRNSGRPFCFASLTASDMMVHLPYDNNFYVNPMDFR
jgi:hypothetical protein